MGEAFLLSGFGGVGRFFFTPLLYNKLFMPLLKKIARPLGPEVCFSFWIPLLSESAQMPLVAAEIIELN